MIGWDAANWHKLANAGGWVRREVTTLWQQRFKHSGSSTLRRRHEQAFGSAFWLQLLDDCLVATGAKAAFLIDVQGLVVSTSGMQAAQAEKLGGRLMIALDQAAAMNSQDSAGARAAVSVELADQWLTGIRFPRDGVQLVLGVIGPRPLSTRKRRVVEDRLRAASRAAAD